MNDIHANQETPELPDFELLRQVGQGGFGAVWLARNRATGKLRAVKMIPLQCSTDRAGRELTSLSRLERQLDRRHEHLIDIHHVGRTAEYLYYVMDPADGVDGRPASDSPDYRPATLRSLLDEGPLEAEACARHARALLEGLACLHAIGMAHRDVKPSNCLIVDRRLKLADFGLLTESQPSASRMGTLTYMPPDGRMDARADVYAAGLILYEMISGQPAERFPHLGVRAATIAADVRLASLNRVALHACQPVAGDRFSDARAMLDEFDAVETRLGRRHPRRRLTAMGLAMVLTAALVIGAVTWLRPTPRVSVNFITEPLFEATIWVDGRQLVEEDGTPHTTPCTVPDVAARPSRVVFRHPEAGEYDAGMHDFRTVREVTARWEP
ncbi:MAG TPA: hypothetical protein DD670_05545 [Planctomycetaceae bacterium]|nr:hypothetical protein [Planctomycetaceae bacterium]